MHQRQLSLGMFIYPTGHHIAGWRHPDASWKGMEGFEPFRQIAVAAERARYDFIFLADGLGVINMNDDGSSAYMPPVSHMDPLMLNASLAAVTSNIGLIATVSTTFNEPYHLARKIASLDILSGGRAGWNLVTSITSRELSHLRTGDIPPAETRYDRAEEFADIVCDLWDSVDHGALPYDLSSGKVIDFDKVQSKVYQGQYFDMRGPLDVLKSPQGRPVVVQAGSSGPGIALAARVADVVFAANPDKETAKAFYKKIKAAVVRAGRLPSACLVMPGLMPIIGTSKQHAEDIKASYEALIDEQLARVVLRRNFFAAYRDDIDLSLPPPDDLFTDSFSRIGIMREMSEKGNFTTMDLARSISFARGHNVVCGTANDVADRIEDWFGDECADGFNIMPPSYMNGMNDFDRLVIPELQRRGIFRTEYASTTMRGNLGLDAPSGPAWRKQNL